MAIVEGAAEAFCQYGFARTQMADIAREADVALGTLYRYAPSKDALFQMALLAGAGADEAEIAAAGAERDLFAFIEGGLLSRLSAVRELEAALEASPEADDPVDLFFGVLFDVIQRVQRALRMLDRSSREWPELSGLFAARLRAPALLAVEQFIVRMSAAGRVGPIADARTTARIIVEMAAWFAMHRRFTPDAPDITDAEARDAVLCFIAAALRPSAQTDRPQSKRRNQK